MDNWTTAIQRLARSAARRSWRSWKLCVNGYLGELVYDIGAIDHDARFSVRTGEGRPRMSLGRSGTR